MIIKSTVSSAALEFGPVRGDYVDVTLNAPDHRGSREVFLYTDAPRLSRLFAQAADDWKGWEGVRNWTSVEGELSLDLESDRLGHVTMTVQISCASDRAEPWDLKTTIQLEAGALASIAKEAAAHFGAGSS